MFKRDPYVNSSVDDSSAGPNGKHRELEWLLLYYYVKSIEEGDELMCEEHAAHSVMTRTFEDMLNKIEL